MVKEIHLMTLIPKPKYRARLHGTLPEGNRDTWLIENDKEEFVLDSISKIVDIRELSGWFIQDLND